MKTLIIALGGNALIQKGQEGNVSEQFNNLEIPLSKVAKLYGKYNLVITHGNGPQVGNLLLQQQATSEVPEMPLEVLVAMTQGQIGYMIEKTLDNELMKIGIMHPLLSTLSTYVQVDANDPAFKNPTKPIGPAYKNKKPGFVKTAKGWRKVVASPKPIRIVGSYKIKELLKAGFLVVTCGGGGIPVIKREEHNYHGIEAVIDKDLASAKLGEEIGADILLIVTDTKGAYLNFGKPNQKLLDKLTVKEAKKHMDSFPAGSMGPKIQAAINFIESGGERAIICHLSDIEKALGGKAGTQITK
ncbi:MAG: carbamate kinase [archaeon]